MMAETSTATFTVSDLSDLNVRNLGSFKGINLGASLEGTATTSGDSDYKLVQSIDKTNWIDVPGATFADLANEVLPVSLPDVLTMLYLGVQMTSVGTETTGSVTVSVVVK